MISDTIKALRKQAGMSQTELAQKLDVTRSSVNAWEQGISFPTIQYIIKIAKLFHTSSDYLLGIESKKSLALDGYTQDEIEILYKLIAYFDSQK